ncbi:MAG: hypothetical protein D8M59_00820 [Planctomycetes bacterium]|nr:hypothetical protein [Planctomycetota bacterium]
MAHGISALGEVTVLCTGHGGKLHDWARIARWLATIYPEIPPPDYLSDVIADACNPDGTAIARTHTGDVIMHGAKSVEVGDQGIEEPLASGSGNWLYQSPLIRVGAWIEHADSVVKCLIDYVQAAKAVKPKGMNDAWLVALGQYVEVLLSYSDNSDDLDSKSWADLHKDHIDICKRQKTIRTKLEWESWSRAVRHGLGCLSIPSDKRRDGEYINKKLNAAITGTP